MRLGYGELMLVPWPREVIGGYARVGWETPYHTSTGCVDLPDSFLYPIFVEISSTPWPLPCVRGTEPPNSPELLPCPRLCRDFQTLNALNQRGWEDRHALRSWGTPLRFVARWGRGLYFTNEFVRCDPTDPPYTQV